MYAVLNNEFPDRSDSDEEYKPSEMESSGMDDDDDAASAATSNKSSLSRQGSALPLHSSRCFPLANDVISKSERFVASHSSKECSRSQLTVEMHSNETIRIYDKGSACLYFGKFIIKMSAHLLEDHKDKESVKEIIDTKIGSIKRKLLLEKIWLEGNFVHNIEVLQHNKGNLLILRRSSKKKSKAYKCTPMRPEEYMTSVRHVCILANLS